jgi:hypothetical protein
VELRINPLVFSERIQFLEIFALELEFRFQSVSDGQHHRIPIPKIERQDWSAANLGCAAEPGIHDRQVSGKAISSVGPRTQSRFCLSTCMHSEIAYSLS